MKKLTGLLPKQPDTFIFVLAPVLLTYAVVAAFFNSAASIDKTVFDFIAPHITPGRTGFMRFVSIFANHLFLIPFIIALIVYLIIIKHYAVAIKIAAVVLTMLGLLSLIKRLVHRHRPDAPLVFDITNYSFPSGHSMMSVALYGLMIIFAAKAIKTPWKKNLVILVLLGVIFCIGLSRLYLRVHYPTDVLAGWSIGVIWLLISVRITDSVLDKYKKKLE
jgi:membrane-associated phospholipid phosphatase